MLIYACLCLFLTVSLVSRTLSQKSFKGKKRFQRANRTAGRSRAPSNFMIAMGDISNAVSSGHCIVSTSHGAGLKAGRRGSVAFGYNNFERVEEEEDDEDMVGEIVV